MDSSKVLIIIDALGYELAKRYQFSPGGFVSRKRLRSVLGFSQAALTSIFTGRDPNIHGIWNMYSFALDSSPFGWIRLLPSNISSRRLWLRRLIRWKIKHISGIRSYYSLYSIPRSILPFLDLPAVKHLFTHGVENCRTILDSFVREKVFVRDYRMEEKSAFRDLSESLKGDNFDLYILYTAGLDSDLHRYGNVHPAIESRLSWYGEKLEEIAGIRDDIRIVVLGDHGMVDVSRHFDLIAGVEALGLQIPGDYIPFYDSTMARYRINSDRARLEITGLLSELSWGRLLDDREKKKLGVYFEDGRYGDIIFLVNAGNIILPSYMSSDPVAGMHGYHPDVAEMYSVMFSNFSVDGEEGSIKDIPELLTGEDDWQKRESPGGDKG